MWVVRKVKAQEQRRYKMGKTEKNLSVNLNQESHHTSSFPTHTNDLLWLSLPLPS